MTSFDLGEQRKFRRIQLSETDGIYCIVLKAKTGDKTITLPTVDFSQNGFKFSIIPKMKDEFFEGEKLFLKAIAGSRNLTFEEPVELVVRWQNIDIRRNTVNIGCEICAISSASDKQFIQFIRSEIKFGGRWRQQTQQMPHPGGHARGGTVLSISGSQGKNGNTAAVLGWVEERLKILGHRVERIDLCAKQIHGCLGCLQCKSTTEVPGCVQRDDLQAVIDKMVETDAVLFAAPVILGGFGAPMKALIDRCHCLYRGTGGSAEHASFLEGKRLALIATAGDAFAEDAGPSLSVFRRLGHATKTQRAGELFVCRCRDPKDIPDSVRARAFALANQLFAAPASPYAVLIPGDGPKTV